MIRYKKYYEKNIEDIEEKIKIFFCEKSFIYDCDIQKITDKLCISLNEFNQIVYNILNEKLNNDKI